MEEWVEEMREGEGGGEEIVRLLPDSQDGRESPASESSHSSWYQSDSSLGPSEGHDCASTHFYVSRNSKVLPNPHL